MDSRLDALDLDQRREAAAHRLAADQVTFTVVDLRKQQPTRKATFFAG